MLYMFGQTKRTGEANMYPKPVQDLAGMYHSSYNSYDGIHKSNLDLSTSQVTNFWQIFCQNTTCVIKSPCFLIETFKILSYYSYNLFDGHKIYTPKV